MSNITKKTKIIAIILGIIAIAGIITIFSKGFNFELELQKTNKIELHIEKEFEISDVKNIVNEIMPNEQVVIQKVEVYEDSISIIAKGITDEQKQNIVEKINEKYQTELSTENIEIEKVPNLKGFDIIKPYIITFTISTIIILVYLAIRYNKLGIIKTLAKAISIILIAQLELFSIVAITRIPVGKPTIPMVIVVYMLSLSYITNNLEKNRKQRLEEENKKA